jgi:hypothetical protein
MTTPASTASSHRHRRPRGRSRRPRRQGGGRWRPSARVCGSACTTAPMGSEVPEPTQPRAQLWPVAASPRRRCTSCSATSMTHATGRRPRLRAAAGTASTRSCHALAHRAHHATHVPLTHALTEEQARAEGERERRREERKKTLRGW